jgi:hypothetical protein
MGSEDQRFAESLQQMDRSSGKRPKDIFRSAVHDALIAVTAREYGLVLLTQDKNCTHWRKKRGDGRPDPERKIAGRFRSEFPRFWFAAASFVCKVQSRFKQSRRGCPAFQP